MATGIWCEFVCHHCACSAEGQHTYGAIPRKAMKQRATKSGWVFAYDEAFCTADCLAAFDKDSQPQTGI